MMWNGGHLENDVIEKSGFFDLSSFNQNLNLLDYVHIPSKNYVNEKQDIDACVTQFSCMNHNTVYVHGYNMTFNNIYYLMTSTMKDTDHHVMFRHIQ